MTVAALATSRLDGPTLRKNGFVGVSVSVLVQAPGESKGIPRGVETLVTTVIAVEENSPPITATAPSVRTRRFISCTGLLCYDRGTQMEQGNGARE